MHRHCWTSLRLLPHFQCHWTRAALSLPTVNGNFGLWREGRNSNASVSLLESKLQGFLGFSKFLKAQVKNIFIFPKDRNAANPALSHKRNYTFLIIHAAAAELHASQGQTLHKCGFYSLFPPSSCSSHLSFFTLTLLHAGSPWHWIVDEQIQLSPHVMTRGKVFLRLPRPSSLYCDNEYHRNTLMEI